MIVSPAQVQGSATWDAKIVTVTPQGIVVDGLAPHLVEQRLVQRHQPALSDDVARYPIGANGLPLLALSPELSSAASELQHEIMSNQHSPLDEAQHPPARSRRRRK